MTGSKVGRVGKTGYLGQKWPFPNLCEMFHKVGPSITWAQGLSRNIVKCFTKLMSVAQLTLYPLPSFLDSGQNEIEPPSKFKTPHLGIGRIPFHPGDNSRSRGHHQDKPFRSEKNGKNPHLGPWRNHPRPAFGEKNRLHFHRWGFWGRRRTYSKSLGPTENQSELFLHGRLL